MQVNKDKLSRPVSDCMKVKSEVGAVCKQQFLSWGLPCVGYCGEIRNHELLHI